MELILLIAVVVVAALVVVLLFRRPQSRLNEKEMEQVVATVRGEMAELQAEALRSNTEQFLSLAEGRLKEETARGEEQLKARKQEIDKGLQVVGEATAKLRDYVESTDTRRGESIAGVVQVVKESRKTMEALSAATGKLSEVLTASQARGQWGERMADDVLRAAGLVEGVNYEKNKQIAEGTTRPDFTFRLPDDLVVNMDVKFPLAAYIRYVDSDSDAERDAATKEFLRDVRSSIKSVTTRDYIDPSNGTVDCMLLFIPNEQVYGFIHEHDAEVAEDALRQGVVLCSPLTLFPVLAVIRRAVESFHLAQQTDEILKVLGSFNQQWAKYKDAMETVQKRMGSTQRAFDTLVGVRTRVLDRQVDKVELLRMEAGLDAEGVPEAEEAVPQLIAGAGDLED